MRVSPSSTDVSHACNRYFAENIRDEYANGQLDAQVESVLGEMKELSIYGI